MDRDENGMIEFLFKGKRIACSTVDAIDRRLRFMATERLERKELLLL